MKISATTVMTSRVYRAEAALAMVRSYAGEMLETITRGYRFRKMVATRPTIPMAVATNAQPSSRSRSSHSTTATATIASTGTIGGTIPVLC